MDQVNRKKSKNCKPHNQVKNFYIYVQNVVEIGIRRPKFGEVKQKADQTEAYDEVSV